MKIVFIGLLDFSYHCLSEVLHNDGEVVGIVTKSGSNYNSDYKDLTPLADRHHIPVHLCRNVNDEETVRWIKDKSPDIIFCWGWSQLIKEELLALPPMGIIGVHPALLPENRGRHPLIWALVLGLSSSGLTFFKMDEGADSGPILSQRSFDISEEDTAATLYDKIKVLATQQIMEFLPALSNCTYQLIPQEESRSNYWRKRSVNDGVIDWRMSGRAIYNLIRALTKPYPGAHFIFKDEAITVWSASLVDEAWPSNIEPGKVVDIHEGHPVIKCSVGSIKLHVFEPLVDLQIGDYVL